MPASQVEVQAPPGLELMPGSTGPGNGGEGGALPQESPSSDETAYLQAQAEKELKDELVREVTAAVREHIDHKTSAAVDSLWQRGQKAIEYLQKQQTSQSEHLRGQLAACAESYRNLERENAALRSGLEALMKHLTMTFGPPPHLQANSPFFPQAAQQPTAAPAPEPPAAVPAPAAAPAAAQAGLPKPSQSPAGARRDPEEFLTPATSPLRSSPVDDLLFSSPHLTPQQLPHVAGFPAVMTEPTPVGLSDVGAEAAACGAASGGTGSEPTAASEPVPPSSQTPATPTPATPGSSSTAPFFSLTLRRADNVPLGLDVRGDTGSPCLIVEAVRPGGAIEAWNRQCAGDTREIRTGDHIIKINSSEDAEGMREQCLTKHLLKMTVQRVFAGEAEPSSANSGLRADAFEFVPQVGSWAGYAAPASVTTC